MKANQLKYEPDPNKFDLVVQRWDNQGNLAGPPNHYRTHIQGDAKYYERPVGSGNLWHENNQPAGRVTYVDGKKSFDTDAAHIDYVAPLSGHAKLHFEAEAARNRVAELEAELASIRKERAAVEAKVQPKVEPVPGALSAMSGPPVMPKRGG